MHLKLPFRWKFARDDRAVAAVEFALILPLLVTLYFGTVEAASLYSVDRRVATVASTMADLVSREKDQISKSDTLAKYFQAATAILRPYSTANLKQVVTMLSVSSSGVTKVIWSVANGTGATARVANDPYPLAATTQINQIARTKGYLVVSEISYSYKPVFGLVISKPISLRHTEYYLPRYENKIDLKP